MFDPLAPIAVALLGEPAPGTWGAWAGKPEAQVPLAIGLTALVVAAAVKLPDFLSWRRARHKEVFSPMDLEQVLQGTPPVVVDLRAPEDFNGPAGHIRGAHNMLPSRLVQGLGTISPDRRQLVVLVDRDDRASHRMAPLLQSQGYTWVRVLRGGMRAWRAGNLPVSVSGRQG